MPPGQVRRVLVVVAPASVGRVLGVERLVQLVADVVDDLRRADHRGHVVDEVDQHARRRQGHEDRQRDAELRHEVGAGLLAGADDAEDHQRVEERGHEHAQRELHAAVGGEGAEQARAVLARSQSEGCDGDGEDGGRDGDGAAGDGLEHAAGPLGPGIVEQHDRLVVLVEAAEVAVEQRHRHAQGERAQGHEAGQKPEAVTGTFDQHGQSGTHGAAAYARGGIAKTRRRKDRTQRAEELLILPLRPPPSPSLRRAFASSRLCDSAAGLSPAAGRVSSPPGR